MGMISAKNRDHGGASFRIRLPLVGTPDLRGAVAQALRRILVEGQPALPGILSIHHPNDTARRRRLR